MSKRKSKKKKQKKDSRKLSSSSSDDNDKSSKEEERTKKRKSSERRHHSSRHDGSAEKQRKEKRAHCSASRNGASESSSQKDREFKKAVYKLGKTESLDRRHHAKEEVSAESKNASWLGTLTQDHSRKSCPSQDRKSGSGRSTVDTPEGKTSERGSSKSASTHRAIRVSQTDHKTPIVQVSPSRSSQWSPSQTVVTPEGKTSERGSSKSASTHRAIRVSQRDHKTPIVQVSPSRSSQWSPSQTVVTPEGKTSERGSSKSASTHRAIRVSQSDHKTPIFQVSPSRSSQWSPSQTVVTPEGKTSERGSSKSASTHRAMRVSQSDHKTPIFQVSPSQSKSPSQTVSPRQTLMSPRSVSLKLKEQRKAIVKRRSEVEGTSNTEKDSQVVQLSPSLAEELREKRRKLVKRRSQEEREEVLKTKRDLVGGKGFSPPSNTAITTEQASTSTKNITTPERCSIPSKLMITQKQGKVTEPFKTSKFMCAQGVIPPAKPLPLNFKIQKKTKPVPVSAIWEDDKDSTNNEKPISSIAQSEYQSTVSHKTGIIPSVKESVVNRTDQRTAIVPNRSDSSHPHPLTHPSQHQAPRDGAAVLDSSVQGVTSTCDRTRWIKQTQTTVSSTEKTDIYDNDQEMQLVEELHLARSQRRLEVNVVEIYGELTCMDIDQPEEGANVVFSKEHPQQDLLIVLDTNILLSHLDFVKKMRSHGLGPLGFPTVLIPWVVLQELDSLKNGKRLSSAVAHLATPAVQFIYTCLKSLEPRLWGQSMQQASQSSHGLRAENNDDRVLQCCLQYQSLYPEAALILCTNDKNLCSKGLLSGVKALSKTDLVEEVGRFKPGPQTLTHTPVHTHTQTLTSIQSGIQTSHKGHQLKDQRRMEEGERWKEEERKRSAAEARELSTCLSILEDCLKGALSQVLESEMKAAYEELWTEIVFLKPPWTLGDLLLCFKKHWYAVFGSIVSRNLQQSVENLIKFFNSGKKVDRSNTVPALYEAKTLLEAFGRRADYGGCIPPALCSLDTLLQRIHPQPARATGELHINDGDTLMVEAEEGEEEEEEGKQATPPQPSHQEVWALFENIWTNVCQISSAVFTALHFDPGAMVTSQLDERPPPPQDAVSCLHKLSSALTHLLQGFTRVLSPDGGLEDSQALLSFIRSSEIAAIEPRFTGKHMFECLSQQEYREKLHVGGTQLASLSVTLERCAQATARRVNCTTWT